MSGGTFGQLHVCLHGLGVTGEKEWGEVLEDVPAVSKGCVGV